MSHWIGSCFLLKCQKPFITKFFLMYSFSVDPVTVVTVESFSQQITCNTTLLIPLPNTNIMTLLKISSSQRITITFLIDWIMWKQLSMIPSLQDKQRRQQHIERRLFHQWILNRIKTLDLFVKITINRIWFRHKGKYRRRISFFCQQLRS